MVTLPHNARQNMRAQLSYTGPIPAPIEAGQPVGDVLIVAPGIEPMRLAMVAGESIGEVGRVAAVVNGVRYSLFGLNE